MVVVDGRLVHTKDGFYKKKTAINVDDGHSRGARTDVLLKHGVFSWRLKRTLLFELNVLPLASRVLNTLGLQICFVK
jgi:hypothetical protein